MRNYLIRLLLTTEMADGIIAMDKAARKCHGVGPRENEAREAWLSVVKIATKRLSDNLPYG